jgi:hypothetical protein
MIPTSSLTLLHIEEKNVMLNRSVVPKNSILQQSGPRALRVPKGPTQLKISSFVQFRERSDAQTPFNKRLAKVFP